MLDLLIIGSGGAGLSAALTARACGASVTVVTKALPTTAQTAMAQGGINAVITNTNQDSVASHIADTMKSAHGLADEVMVENMCQDASKTIDWLHSIGVPFSRKDDAPTPIESIAQRRLGGASASRACYAQDYTGLKILHTLYDQCLKAGIRFVTEHYLLNLVKDDDMVVYGATFWDMLAGEVVSMSARSTILATGGYGELYHQHTTNSIGSTGDGLAVVLRAGGVLSDMEFVQFHPTALKGSCVLISESARGEGGYLIDHKGERFTDELAPRDEVARAIFRQMEMGHSVYLDIRHLGEEKITTLMPQELHLCRLHADIDPIKEPIPIMPVVHYTMGGVVIDREFAIAGLKGCYAVGECSNANVHGANRLGGNSLLEIVTFGRKVAKIALEDKQERSKTNQNDIDTLFETQITLDRADIDSIFTETNEINFYGKRKVLGKLLYKEAGILRDKNALNEAIRYLKTIQEKLPNMGVGDKSRKSNQNLVEFLEFRNSILLSETLLKSALYRQESRGAHYREDFPITRDNFCKHSYCDMEAGEIRIV